MENDKLRDIIKMDFPDVEIDNEKIISLCKNQKNRVNKSIILKLVLSLSCVILVMVTILTISYNGINEPISNETNNGTSASNNRGFETPFTGYEGGNSKASLGYDIGYRTDSSVFNIEEVRIELMVGHFFGPCSKRANQGQVDDTYSFDYDSWKDGPYYSSERADQYGIAKIFIRTDLYPSTVEEEVYSIENFYDNFLFIYTMAQYEKGKHQWFQYENIEARNTIKDFLIDKKFFKNDEGEISIGIGFGNGGGKYVNIFYFKDIDNNTIYLSNLSIEDAKNKYIENSIIKTKYVGYEGEFQ